MGNPFRWTSSILVFYAIALPLTVAEPVCPVTGTMKTKFEINVHVVRTINVDLTACVEVRKNGRAIYHETRAAGYYIRNSIADSPDVSQSSPEQISLAATLLKF